MKIKGKVPDSRRVHYYESEDGLNWHGRNWGYANTRTAKLTISDPLLGI